MTTQFQFFNKKNICEPNKIRIHLKASKNLIESSLIMSCDTLISYFNHEPFQHTCPYLVSPTCQTLGINKHTLSAKSTLYECTNQIIIFVETSRWMDIRDFDTTLHFYSELRWFALMAVALCDTDSEDDDFHNNKEKDMRDWQLKRITGKWLSSDCMTILCLWGKIRCHTKFWECQEAEHVQESDNRIRPSLWSSAFNYSVCKRRASVFMRD